MIHPVVFSMASRLRRDGSSALPINGVGPRSLASGMFLDSLMQERQIIRGGKLGCPQIGQREPSRR